jgi:uncharacterized repeat protein (TIGR01451 family)
LNSQTGLEDVARIAYTVENLGTVSHSVGLRFMNDTMINNDDGAPFRIPEQGILTTESDFTGSNVPDSFQVFYDVTNDYHVASATLRGGDATYPDRLVLAYWGTLYVSLWDYTTDPGFSFTHDAAYALYWDPTDLAPGASRTYVTYYGLGQFDANLAPPLGLGLSGPASLALAGGGYSPNPFTITATVLNNGTATATDVQLSLNLPSGLSLAGGTAVQSLGDVPVGVERQVSWSILAQPQTAGTVLTYSVTASATNADDKTISRQIAVPAVAVGTPADLADLLIEDFDQWSANGELQGAGPGKSAANRLEALRNILLAAHAFIDAGDYAAAIDQLEAALAKTDGNANPPDFVTGDAADDLAAAIQDLIAELEALL